MLARMRLLLLAVLVPAVAVAQPQRDMATVCSSSPTGDDLTACGNYFLDMFQRAPSAAGADEHLYNAGTMFVGDHAIMGAISAFTLLRKSFPRSRLAPRALARIAQLYGQVMMLDKAAEALEQYASTYASEKDAYFALSDAIRYRQALGDDAKVVEQTKLFVRNYGLKKPAEAAAVTFALTAVYEKRGDREATVEHLRRYIQQFGVKGGRGELVIAYAKIGQLRWRQSCPVTPIDGECVRVKRKPAPVCEGGRSVERVKRDDRAVKEALAAFASAIRTYETTSADSDDAVARYYYGRALLERIDVEAEASPMPVAPQGAKLAAWTRDQVFATKLALQYESVGRAKDAAAEIVAASRIARLSDDIAGAIVATAANPSQCKALDEAAARSRKDAIRAYSLCLIKTSELGLFDETTRTCEAALTRLVPDQFPPLRELVRTTPSPATLVVVDGP